MNPENPFELPEVLECIIKFADFSTLQTLRLVRSDLNELIIPILYKKFYLSLPFCSSDEQQYEKFLRRACDNPKSCFINKNQFKFLKIDLSSPVEDSIEDFLLNLNIKNFEYIKKIILTGDCPLANFQLGLANWLQDFSNLKFLLLPSLEQDGFYPDSETYWPLFLTIFKSLDHLQVENMDKKMMQLYFESSSGNCNCIKNLIISKSIYMDEDLLKPYIHTNFNWNINDVWLKLHPSTCIKIVRKFLIGISSNLKSLTFDFDQQNCSQWEFGLVNKEEFSTSLNVFKDNWYLPTNLHFLESLELRDCIGGTLEDSIPQITTLIAALQLPNLKNLSLFGYCRNGTFKRIMSRVLGRSGQLQCPSLVQLDISGYFQDDSIFDQLIPLWPNLKTIKFTRVDPSFVSKFLTNPPRGLEKLFCDELENSCSWDRVFTGVEIKSMVNGGSNGVVTSEHYSGPMKMDQFKNQNFSQGSLRNLKELKLFKVNHCGQNNFTDSLINNGLIYLDHLSVVQIKGFHKTNISEEAKKQLEQKMGFGAYLLIR